MKKFEYKVFNAKQNKELRFIWKNLENFESFLNEQGQSGWKLIVERDLGGTYTMIFQRSLEN